VGDERVGKTTLAVAMGCDGDTAKRTAGIEVHRVQRAEFNGRVLVYDIAGHREFHCTHSFFLGGIATMFVLVINSSLSLAEIIAISQYWLAFILSSRYPADLGYQPYMLTVGSYGDTEESKRKQQLQLNDAMKVVQQEFHGRFTFVRIKDDGDEFILVDDNPDYDKDCVVLDCRNQHSEDMKKLLRLIGKIREKCLQV
jgi:GTPase SAR1 family protein